MSSATTGMSGFDAEIFTQLPVPTLLFDREGDLIAANPALLALLDIESADQLAHRSLFTDALLDDAGRVTLQSGKSVTVVEEVTLRDWLLAAVHSKPQPCARLEMTFVPLGGSQRGYLATVRRLSSADRPPPGAVRSEGLYADLVDSLDDLLWQCDRVGRYTYLNAAWERVLGYRAEEMLGRFFTDFMTVHQAGQDRPVFESIMSDGSIHNYETVYLKKNGEPVELAFNAKVLTDSLGRPVGGRGIARDITRQKQAQRELVESEQRYRQMVHSSPMGMHFYELQDDALVFTDANPAADRLLDVTNAQFIGKTIEEAFPPLAQTEIPARYRRAARDGIPWFTEQIAYSDEKIVGAFEVHAFQISPNRMVAVFLEITDRKRAEVNLKNEKERISVTLRSIGDGVIATDTQGRITLMNKVAESLTGWTFADASGRPLAQVFNIVNEVTKAPTENPVDRVLRTTSVVELENHTVLIAKDGTERIIADSGAPIFDAGSGIIGVVLVFRDVTERSKLRDAMQRTQRLESLGVLAGGIAHDFNNLLGGVFGYLDLAKEVTDDPAVQDYLEKSFFSLARARGLTQQLLTFAKGGEPILKTQSIENLVAQSAKFSLSGTNVRAECDFEANLWRCEVDENQFGQVIDNITINAQQSMPRGGIVRIRARNATVAPGDHPTLRPGNYVHVSIADSGVGIPKESLPLVFDPFFTTKQKGSGLGLSTCYSIMQKHGGAIDVTSELGVGTVFHLHLPASNAGSEQRLPVARDTQLFSGRVLVMDDEDFLRDILGAMLRRSGFVPVCVATGEAAIAAVQAQDPSDPFVAAILDLTIVGGLGGLETVAQLNALAPELPVLVSSGYSEDPVMCNPKKFGFVAAIPKPFRKRDLCEALQAHLKPSGRR